MEILQSWTKPSIDYPNATKETLNDMSWYTAQIHKQLMIRLQQDKTHTTFYRLMEYIL